MHAGAERTPHALAHTRHRLQLADHRSAVPPHRGHGKHLDLNTHQAPTQNTQQALGCTNMEDIEAWGFLAGSDNRVKVSTHGRISFLEQRTGEWKVTSPVASKTTGYCTFRHKGSSYTVHRVVWETFRAPIPDGLTIDHIAKYNGDVIRERSDNRLSNIRLADGPLQATNKKQPCERRDAQAIVVWKPGEPEQVFHSAHAAQVALGIHANALRKTAKGMQSSASGYYVRFANDVKAIGGEQFKFVEGAFVSQFGRYLDRTHSFPIKATVSTGNGYATFQSDNRSFHRTVALAWPEICGRPNNADDTVDHIDGDVSNNNASNLRWASKQLQAENRTTSLGKIQSLQPGAEEWNTHRSTMDACRWMAEVHQISLKDCVLSYGFKHKGRHFKIKKGKAANWRFRIV